MNDQETGHPAGDGADTQAIDPAAATNAGPEDQGTAGPGEAGHPDGKTDDQVGKDGKTDQQTVNWEKRYNDARSELTKKTEKVKELERMVESGMSTDAIVKKLKSDPQMRKEFAQRVQMEQKIEEMMESGEIDPATYYAMKALEEVKNISNRQNDPAPTPGVSRDEIIAELADGKIDVNDPVEKSILDNIKASNKSASPKEVIALASQALEAHQQKVVEKWKTDVSKRQQNLPPTPTQAQSGKPAQKKPKSFAELDEAIDASYQ